MKAFIVIATKGRANETYTLLDYLARQSYPIEKIIIVGSEPKDIENLENHHLEKSNNVIVHLSTKVGLTIQRNVGLNALNAFTTGLNTHEWFVTFFDDDFRPADDWIKNAAKVYESHSDLVGLGGWVVADGVSTGSISEEQAKVYLQQHTGQSDHLSNSESPCGLYGCNMSFRGNVGSEVRFDENLPLYGWQEDIDYSTIAAKFGKLIYTNQCIGVHIGASSGRTSGVRFGYSQIANPLYLVKKGTMSSKFAFNLMSRNLASNIRRTATFNQTKDYKGRLYGNWVAFKDLIQSELHPLRMLQSQPLPKKECSRKNG